MARPETADLEWQLFGSKVETDSKIDSSLEWAGNADKTTTGSFGDLNGMGRTQGKGRPHLIWDEPVEGMVAVEKEGSMMGQERPEEEGDPLIVYGAVKKRTDTDSEYGVIRRNSQPQNYKEFKEGRNAGESARLGRYRSRSGRTKKCQASRERLSENHPKRIAKMYLMKAKRYTLKSLLFSKSTLSGLARCQVSRYTEMTNYFGGRDLRKALMVNGEGQLRGLALERALMTELFPTLYRSQNTYSDFSSSSLEEEESRASQEMYKVLETAVRYRDVLKMGLAKRDVIYEKIFRECLEMSENDENAGNEGKKLLLKGRGRKNEMEEGREVFFESFGKSFFGKDKHARADDGQVIRVKNLRTGLRQALKSKIKNWTQKSQFDQEDREFQASHEMRQNMGPSGVNADEGRRQPLMQFDSNNQDRRREMGHQVGIRERESDRSSFDGYLETVLGSTTIKHLNNRELSPAMSHQHRKNLIYFDCKGDPKMSRMQEIYRNRQDSDSSQNNFLAASDSSLSLEKEKKSVKSVSQTQLKNEFILFTKEGEYDFSRKEGQTLYENRKYYFEEKGGKFQCEVGSEERGEALLVQTMQDKNEVGHLGLQDEDRKSSYQHWDKVGQEGGNGGFPVNSIYDRRKYSGKHCEDSDAAYQIYTPPKQRQSGDLTKHTQNSKSKTSDHLNQNVYPNPGANAGKFESNTPQRTFFRNNTTPMQRIQHNLTQTDTLSSSRSRAHRSYYCSSILEGPSSVETSSKRNFGRCDRHGFKKSPKITSNVKINSISGYGNGSSTLSSAQDFLRVEASFPSLILNQHVGKRVGRFDCPSGEAIQESEIENEMMCERDGEEGASYRCADEERQNLLEKSNGTEMPRMPEMVSENANNRTTNADFKSFSNNQQDMIPGIIQFESKLKPCVIKNLENSQVDSGQKNQFKLDLSVSKNITEESNLLEDEAPHSSSFSNNFLENHVENPKPKIFESIFSFKHDSLLLSSRVGLEGRIASGVETGWHSENPELRRNLTKGEGVTSLMDNGKVKGGLLAQNVTQEYGHAGEICRIQNIMNRHKSFHKNNTKIMLNEKSRSQTRKNKIESNFGYKSRVEQRDMLRQTSRNSVLETHTSYNLAESRQYCLKQPYSRNEQKNSRANMRLKNAKSNPDFFKDTKKQKKGFNSQKNSISLTPEKNLGNPKVRNRKVVIQEFLNSMSQEKARDRQFYTPKKKAKQIMKFETEDISFSENRASRKNSWNGSRIEKETKNQVNSRQNEKTHFQKKSSTNLKIKNREMNKNGTGVDRSHSHKIELKKTNAKTGPELSISTNLCVFIGRKRKDQKQEEAKHSQETIGGRGSLENNFMETQNDNHDVKQDVSHNNSPVYPPNTSGGERKNSKIERKQTTKSKRANKSKQRVAKRREINERGGRRSKISLMEIEKLGQIIEEQQEFIRSRSQNKMKKGRQEKENVTSGKKRRKKRRPKVAKRLGLGKQKEKKQYQGEIKNIHEQSLNQKVCREKGESDLGFGNLQMDRRSGRSQAPNEIYKPGGNQRHPYSNRKSHQIQLNRASSSHKKAGFTGELSKARSIREAKFYLAEKSNISKTCYEERSEQGYQDTIKKCQNGGRMKIVSEQVECGVGADALTGFSSLKYEDLHERKGFQFGAREQSYRAKRKMGEVRTPARESVEFGACANQSILAKKSFISLTSGGSRCKERGAKVKNVKKVKKTRTRKSGIRSQNHSFYQPDRSAQKLQNMPSKSPNGNIGAYSMTLNSSLSGYLHGKGRSRGHIVYTNPLGSETQKMDKWESLTHQVRNMRESGGYTASHRSGMILEGGGSCLIRNKGYESGSSQKLHRHRTFHKNSDQQVDTRVAKLKRPATGKKGPRLARMKNSKKLINALSKNFTRSRKKQIETNKMMEIERGLNRTHELRKIRINQRPHGGLDLAHWGTKSQMGNSPGQYVKGMQGPFTCKKPSKTAFFRSFKKSFEMSRGEGKELKKKGHQGVKLKAQVGNYSGYGVSNKHRFFRSKV